MDRLQSEKERCDTGLKYCHEITMQPWTNKIAEYEKSDPQRDVALIRLWKRMGSVFRIQLLEWDWFGQKGLNIPQMEIQSIFSNNYKKEEEKRKNRTKRAQKHPTDGDPISFLHVPPTEKEKRKEESCAHKCLQ